MSTIYAQRSSAVRAAKKACGPDQEWAIRMSGNGFTFILLNIDEKYNGASQVLADEVGSDEPTEAEIAESNQDWADEQPDSTDLQIMDLEAKVAANKLGKKLAVTEPANRMAVVDEFNKVTEEQHATHRAEKVRPFQQAKLIIGELVSKGVTARKELIAACVAQGIKLNTADNAHYEMCVRKS